jgi:hypothetical protein
MHYFSTARSDSFSHWWSMKTLGWLPFSQATT